MRCSTASRAASNASRSSGAASLETAPALNRLEDGALMNSAPGRPGGYAHRPDQCRCGRTLGRKADGPVPGSRRHLRREPDGPTPRGVRPDWPKRGRQDDFGHCLTGFQVPTSGRAVLGGTAFRMVAHTFPKRASRAHSRAGGFSGDMTIVENVEVTAVGLGLNRRQAIPLRHGCSTGWELADKRMSSPVRCRTPTSDGSASPARWFYLRLRAAGRACRRHVGRRMRRA